MGGAANVFFPHNGMLDKFYAAVGADSPVPVVIISVAIMLLAGFLGTRLTKLLRLPNVTAYILVEKTAERWW